VAPTTVAPTEVPTTAAASTTTAAPTTSAAPTTTAAPAIGACDAEIKKVDPHDVRNSSDGPPSPVEKHVVVTVKMAGSCGALGISYDPANAGIPSGAAWVLLGGNTTITIAWPEGPGWSDGKHTLLLQNGRGTTPLHSKDLTVK
jgi:hypothetical protein